MDDGCAAVNLGGGILKWPHPSSPLPRSLFCLLMLVSSISSKFYLSFLLQKSQTTLFCPRARSNIVSAPLLPLLSPHSLAVSQSMHQRLCSPPHPHAQHHSSPLRLQHQHPHTHTRRIIPPAKFSSVVLWRREARRRIANCPPPQRSCSLDNLTAFNNSISPRRI